MHKICGISLAGIALLMLLVAGCATGPTRLESAYGMSYHFARVSQTLHAEAAKNLKPVQGLTARRRNIRSTVTAQRLKSHRHRRLSLFPWVGSSKAKPLR